MVSVISTLFSITVTWKCFGNKFKSENSNIVILKASIELFTLPISSTTYLPKTETGYTRKYLWMDL